MNLFLKASQNRRLTVSTLTQEWLVTLWLTHWMNILRAAGSGLAPLCGLTFSPFPGFQPCWPPTFSSMTKPWVLIPLPTAPSLPPFSHTQTLFLILYANASNEVTAPLYHQGILRCTWSLTLIVTSICLEPAPPSACMLHGGCNVSVCSSTQRGSQKNLRKDLTPQSLNCENHIQ